LFLIRLKSGRLKDITVVNGLIDIAIGSGDNVLKTVTSLERKDKMGVLTFLEADDQDDGQDIRKHVHFD